MAVIVDDHLLVGFLASACDEELQGELEDSVLYTTGSWLYRASSAANHGSGRGALSRRLANLSSGRREQVERDLASLSRTIGLVGLRVVVPVMSRLETRQRPNFLIAEALAVALLTDAAILTTTDSPLLQECAQDLDIVVRLIP